ncbi:MAG: phosphoglycerate kinase, partial [Bacteroidota bacterium]|nr:phosphoglycerate kinase [Bacteroidota bacterium]
MDYKNHLNMNINSFNFFNKRALIRVDFNVPINNEGQVTDDTRIRMAIPTIKKVLENNGSVVLMSHLGRPKDEFEKKYSLSQIVGTVEKHLDQSIFFAEDCISDQAFKLTENLQNGQVVLLENLRFYAEEKKGDSSFAMKLAKHGDVYINDAFGTAHRAHASTAVIANYFKEDKMFGHL